MPTVRPEEEMAALVDDRSVDVAEAKKERCCCGLLIPVGSNVRRQHGQVTKVLMEWATLSGALPHSPLPLRLFAWLSVVWTTVCASLRSSVVPSTN